MKKITSSCALLPALFLALAGSAGHAHDAARDSMADVAITAQPVKGNIHMLQGRGGNIGVSAGEDGIFLIDDQFAPLTDKILAALKNISDRPVRFLINTHYHFDHTGGNENLGRRGVVIVAHDNVYKRLNSEQVSEFFNRTTPPHPRAALPVLSFNDRLTFHLNGDHITARHFAHAHTDGDSILIFGNQNVIHTGDLFFNGFYPFIDPDAGGSIYGMIRATGAILELADADTRIIPGHGPLADRQDLQKFHDMLTGVVAALEPLARDGLSLEDATGKNPLKPFNENWGKGFLKPGDFLGLIYPTIQQHVQK